MDNATDTKTDTNEQTNEEAELSPRKKHLAWCKERALAELESGGPLDIPLSWASFVSDMTSNKETKNHPALFLLGNDLVMGGFITSLAEMRRHIEDYN